MSNRFPLPASRFPLPASRFPLAVVLRAGLASALVLDARAYGQSLAPGTSTVVADFGNTGFQGLNAGIAVADGDRWIVVEYRDPAANSNAGGQGLKLFWMDGAEERVLFNASQLTSAYHYPSILTWAGHQDVYVVGKQDVDTVGQQLRQKEILRDDVAAGTIDPLDFMNNPSTSTVEHGRPHRAHDPILGEGHLCWGRDDPDNTSDDDEDVYGKTKDASTWISSTLEYISAADEPVNESHCMMDFLEDGTRMTIVESTSVGLRVCTGNGASIDRLALEESTGPNAHFPAISIYRDTANNESDVWMIAAKDGDLRTWKCENAANAAECDTNAEWTAFDETGGIPDIAPSYTVGDVKLVTVDLGEEQHRFALLARTVGANQVRLYKLCHGDTAWAEVGLLPVEQHYDHVGKQTNPETALGPLGSSLSSVNSFVADGTTLRAVFVAQHEDDTGPTGEDVLEWSVSATHADLCP